MAQSHFTVPAISVATFDDRRTVHVERPDV
jgi:hypothetical protein